MAADLWTSVVSLAGVALGGGLTALAQRATQRSAERAEENAAVWRDIGDVEVNEHLEEAKTAFMNAARASLAGA
ncbi:MULTISPECIES: hypothetical protein [unclassified Streptomyces]|uniref:hypothetical protein n=1 Tax=unclassified Streptomyces TaxID=2593676 RepID=UPI0008518544|nr:MULTISPECIES: hypothetical protein [unclassified Streptomyces]